MRKVMVDLLRAYAIAVMDHEARADEAFARAEAMEAEFPNIAAALRRHSRHYRVAAMELNAKSVALCELHERIFRASAYD